MKLRFLDKIPQKVTQNTGENMGEEVKQIMNEQSQLEAQYSSLIQDRSKLNGIYNKQKFLELQDLIKVVLLYRTVQKSLKKAQRIFVGSSRKILIT